MAATLTQFGQRIERIVSPETVRRMADQAGQAGKKAALDAASKDLGGDRAFSGWKRKVALGAGYDDMGGSTVRINFRPAGMWRLAEAGRRGSGQIQPRKKRAVLTPQGPRASSSYGPSRGLGTFSDAVDTARREVPQAAAKEFRAAVARAV